MLEFGRAKPPREVTRTATEVNANVTEGVFGSRSRDIDLPGTGRRPRGGRWRYRE